VTETRVAKEIDRLLALGGRRTDIKTTGAESWTVRADREGNEFCVGARPKETLIRQGSALEHGRQTLSASDECGMSAADRVV